MDDGCLDADKRGKFHGVEETANIKRTMTTKRMFELVASLQAEYGSKEIVLVDIDTGECVTGKSFVDILLDDRLTWNALWEVEIISVRNDYGHLSIIFDSGIEQTGWMPGHKAEKEGE